VYSSGESGEEEVRIGRLFLKMKEKDKDRRIRHLWYQMLAKAKGAMMIREAFNSLTRRIYLFGTSRKLKYQIEETREPKWYIILPESKFKLVWNIVVLCLLMYTASLTPFTTAFIMQDDPRSLLWRVELAIDCLYVMDFCLNFLMAYEDKDKKIEIRLRFIASHYLQTWAFLDLISCINFQNFEPGHI